ncbi:LpxI family protein [Nitratireductor kimnyeongensis]|uniref:LpxI family protein n=1 Tax=Nitratireductor kimnyeongensis TaxID=430679 RepID=A0ABW0T2V1_9HYPH|nr:UDP-2,3-diacylglucosamine diphosphatase LpxI [Nitratireductor kimnyeongensis]QZZ35431.1 UDP-2,3-diacylglucosamine diphosphatase LpxI [Nitratireductor kimnyeongensis]
MMTQAEKYPALPESARVAVVAGSGALPRDVVRTLVKGGHRPIVIAIEGEADWLDGANVAEFELWPAPAERLALFLPKLQRAGVTHLVLAGGVSRRPPILKVRLGWDVFRALPKLVAAYAKGDDGLLRAVIAHIESKGIRVLGAHEIAPELLAPEGIMTRTKPKASDKKDLEAAYAAARMIGALDIGQAAIAVGGRAVALEGIEGTAGLLDRMRGLRDHGRLAGKSRGAIVKCVKPEQEERADMPTIGPDTIRAAHAAGLAGVGVEAGRSLILDYATTVELADKHGLFVIGLDPEANHER